MWLANLELLVRALRQNVHAREAEDSVGQHQELDVVNIAALRAVQVHRKPRGGVSKLLEEEPQEGDKKNPFNGTLPVRGKLFEGKVVKSKGKDTVVLQKEAPVYFSKFKRYGRSTSRIHAHVPSNLQVNEGDTVIAAECRPIAKSVSFVVVEVKE